MVENCSFCGTPVAFGTGKMFVKKDAKILWFCSRRCEKNMLVLKRNAREVGFTAAYAVAKKQHLAELKHIASGEHGDAPAAPAKKTAKKTAAKKAKSAAPRDDEETEAAPLETEED